MRNHHSSSSFIIAHRNNVYMYHPLQTHQYPLPLQTVFCSLNPSISQSVILTVVRKMARLLVFFLLLTLCLLACRRGLCFQQQNRCNELGSGGCRRPTQRSRPSNTLPVRTNRQCHIAAPSSYHVYNTATRQSNIPLRAILMGDVSPEPIHTAFTVATFLPQPFWVLITVLPNNKITKQIMGGLGTC